jgi:hypothetical protein
MERSGSRLIFFSPSRALLPGIRAKSINKSRSLKTIKLENWENAVKKAVYVYEILPPPITGGS